MHVEARSNAPYFTREVLTRPLGVLGVGFVVAAAFAAAVCLYCPTNNRAFRLYYDTPVIVPFVAFLFDRARRWPGLRWPQAGIDLVVLALSLTRAFYAVPFVSGHALFLTFALLTARSRVALVTAAIIMVEVCYLKAFVWHDASLVGGIVVGCAAAALFRRLQEQATAPATV